MAESCPIETEFIELAQLLKLTDCVSTGGEAKEMIRQGLVKVNGEIETRRGRKLRSGDRVVFFDREIEVGDPRNGSV
ncbi:MAG: RNA-binding S4 domain-containing protein [Candidatus Sericytochromatia bacterium]